MFESVLYDCELCNVKGMSKRELKRHLSINHNKRLKGEEYEFYDYTLVDGNGHLMKELSHFQNLELNFKKLRKTVKLLDELYPTIRIDLEQQTFELEGGFTGQLQFKRSATLSQNDTYQVWAF